MSSLNHRAGLFPALLKHWRHSRGLSQLDLALSADVSSRHISFLETGRSTPSEEMILRLGLAMDVPLRHINEMLRAAGFEPFYPEPQSTVELPKEIRQAIDLLKTHHNPYPFVVINRAYDVVDLNAGAVALFQSIFGGQLPVSDGGLNLARLSFDPNGAQPLIVNFEEVGRSLLWRIHHEVLADPDGPLNEVLQDIIAMPTVPEDWRQPNLTAPVGAAISIHLRGPQHTLKFLTMLTVFQAPQVVLLDELRIETWLPCDEETVAFCQSLAT